MSTCIQTTYLEAIAALGIDADTVVCPTAPREEVTTPSPADGILPMTDAEWQLIVAHLPGEAPQEASMPNRAFVDTVLWVLARGKAWTQIPGGAGEAVRRRFARWAHAGHWPHLSAATRGRGLSAQREAQLAGIAKRALRLQERICARRGVG